MNNYAHSLLYDAAYGRLYGDFHDLLEASAWLLKTFTESEGRSFSPAELEDLLVDINVKFVEHTAFHLRSLGKEIKAMLGNFPDEKSS